MKTMIRFLLGAGLAAAAPAVAAAAPETYIIDGNPTFPRFRYRQFGYSNAIQIN